MGFFSQARAVIKDCSFLSHTLGPKMEVICPETSASHHLPLGERLPSPGKAAPVQARTWQRDNPAAAREGAPSASPAAGAGLEATELEGNVA